MDAVDVGFPPEAHDDDEGVALEVNLLRHLHDDSVHDEIGAVDELRRRLGGVVAAAVLRPYAVVDGVLSLLHVEFAWISVCVFSSEVIDTVGDVARLLDFGEEIAGSDGVEPSGR